MPRRGENELVKLSSANSLVVSPLPLRLSDYTEGAPLANKSKLDQLTAAVAQAELIPTGRFLAALEIELLDDLAARLRQQFFGDRSEEITDLLRRVSVIRTYKRDAPGGFTALAPATVTPTAPLAPPPAADELKRKKKSKGVARAQQKARTHTHSFELRRIAQAGRPMTPSDAQTLDRLIIELEAMSRTVPIARTLWTQALDIRAYLTGKSATPDRDRSGVPSAGRIGQSRGLDMARREVSGGLPASRRGH